jgi:hypothetical protein
MHVFNILGNTQPTVQRTRPGVADAQSRNLAVNVDMIRMGVNESQRVGKCHFIDISIVF